MEKYTLLQDVVILKGDKSGDDFELIKAGNVVWGERIATLDVIAALQLASSDNPLANTVQLEFESNNTDDIAEEFVKQQYYRLYLKEYYVLVPQSYVKPVISLKPLYFSIGLTALCLTPKLWSDSK